MLGRRAGGEVLVCVMFVFIFVNVLRCAGMGKWGFWGAEFWRGSFFGGEHVQGGIQSQRCQSR